MGLLRKISDALSPRKNKVRQEVGSTALQVWAQCSDYENLFAQVRPLVDEMLTVEVFGVGRNHARLPMSRTPELSALYDPNQDMSRTEFLDAVLSTWLTEREVNIHVHKNQHGTIQGYTILPVGCRQRQSDGSNIFYANYLGGAETLGDDEVMTLRFTRSPRNPDKGVSPATAAHYWAVIDDLVAQYQRAFFENGAVPATITFITASSKESYEAKRRELESGLKGARNRNKTIYAWRQLLDDNSTGDEIEVKTIQGNNSTLALKDIIEIVTNKLNMAFGVSNFIMGDDSSAKYDNAELSDQQFTKRRVFPALIKFWSSFQHELDRVTGGLGYAIDFELEIPELTDRLRTQAETRRIEAQVKQLHSDTENNKATLLMTLVQAGATPVSACQATGLITRPWIEVAESIFERAEQQLSQPEPEVPLLLQANHDGHKCTVERTTDSEYEPVFASTEVMERKIYEELVKYAEEITDAVMNQNPIAGRQEVFDAVMAELVKEIDAGAVGAYKVMEKEFASGVIKAELVAELKKGVSGLSYTEQAIRDRLSLIFDNYEVAVQEAAENIIKESLAEGVTQNELKRRLESIVPKARAETIARNETHYAVMASEYDSVGELCRKYDAEAELEWVAHIDERTCPVCRAMDGKKVKLGEAWNREVITSDGEQVEFPHNAYNLNGRMCNAHSRCRCAFAVKVTRQPDVGN